MIKTILFDLDGVLVDAREWHYVPYHAEQLLGVQDTNGWADGCVTEDSDMINDFVDVGLVDIKTWHTPMVLDTSHDEWIWCCGVKK